MVDGLIAHGHGSLKKVLLFSKLSASALHELERRCNWRRYERGDPIIDYLDESNDVFFIIEGEARVVIYSPDGKSVTFRDLGAGDLFGEIAAIDCGPRCASIEAREECTVASIPSAAFRELLRTEPDAGDALLQHFAAQVRRLTTRVFEFSTLAVNNRIQAELLRLARGGVQDGKKARIVPVPTHAEIASRISTHREAVTRELNRLSRLGIIDRQGDVLVVNSVEQLAAMVHDVTAR